MPFVGSKYDWNNYDAAFSEYGNYISDSFTVRGVPSTSLRTTSEVSLRPTDKLNQKVEEVVTGNLLPGGFGGFIGSLPQSWISNNSDSQSQDSQSKIEKSEIVDVKTHNFTLNKNKLITQKVSAAATPHTNITGLNLSSAKGMTIVANATWPISAEISDNRLSWDLDKISLTGYDSNTNDNFLSNLIFPPVVAVNNTDVSTSEVSLGNQIYYPFRSLFTGRKQEELEFKVTDSGDYYTFKTEIPTDLVNGKLIIPALDENEIMEINENDVSQTVEKLPEVYLDGELIQIPPPDTNSFTSEESELRKLSLPPSEVLLAYIKEGNLEIKIPKIKGYYFYNLQPPISNQRIVISLIKVSYRMKK